MQSHMLDLLSFIMKSRLPVEAWILIVLIVEVLIVNWKLVSISSSKAGCHANLIVQHKPKAHIWKPLAHIPCDPILINQLNVSHSSNFQFITANHEHNDHLASIAVRVARGVARRQAPQTSSPDAVCKVSFHESPSSDTAIKGTFRWRMMQDPTQQAIDSFFRNDVSSRKQNPTDEVFQQQVLRAHQYASPTLIHDHGFVGIVERMEESLIVLKLLLNLDIHDILFLNNPSPFDLVNATTCVYQVSPFVSPAMKEFFDSQIWKSHIQDEQALYQEANESLHATIDALGRFHVQKELQRYRLALKQAQSQCSPQAVFPCSKSGQLRPDERTTCHFGSVECGHACLDKFTLAAEEKRRQ